MASSTCPSRRGSTRATTARPGTAPGTATTARARRTPARSPARIRVRAATSPTPRAWAGSCPQPPRRARTSARLLGDAAPRDVRAGAAGRVGRHREGVLLALLQPVERGGPSLRVTGAGAGVGLVDLVLG